MLLGYHYMDFYHMSYAVNQWLANQGYVVLSVNYRSGVGYGKSFRNAANAGGRGNSEYRDVIAAGRYLAARNDVDPNRVGMVGFSAGAMLTMTTAVAGQDAKPAFLGDIYGPMRAMTVPADAPPLFVAVAIDDPLFGG